jgi:hypothetical protein
VFGGYSEVHYLSRRKSLPLWLDLLRLRITNPVSAHKLFSLPTQVVNDKGRYRLSRPDGFERAVEIAAENEADVFR